MSIRSFVPKALVAVLAIGAIGTAMWIWPPSWPGWSGFGGSASTQSASAGRIVTAAASVCLRPQHSVPFGRQPVRINPEGRCAPDLWHDGHCLYVQRAAWTNDGHIYRHCGGALPKDVEWAWSADEPFTGAVALSPPRYGNNT